MSGLQGRGVGRRAVLAAGLGGCARFEAAPVGPAAAASRTVWLLEASAVHTEVLLEWPAEVAVPPPFLVAPFVAVSFGSRDYFASDSGGPVELLRAFVPGPAAILVSPRAGPPDGALALRVGADGPVRLARAVAADLARDGEGRPVLVRAAPEGSYLEAVPPYSLGYTCNTWSLDLLAAAGVPVTGAGVITPQVAMLVARAAARRMASGA